MQNITELINNQYILISLGLLLIITAWYKEIINILKKPFKYINNMKLLEKSKSFLSKENNKETKQNDLSIIINKTEQIIRILESKNLKESSALIRNAMVEITKEYINQNLEEKE